MNKTQLIDAVAEKADISKVHARKSIDAFIDIASETLRTGNKITLMGFGSFVVCRRPARTGRNFRNGASIEIPPKSVVKFRPAMEG